MAFLYRRGMPRTCLLMGLAGLVIYAVYLITPLVVGNDNKPTAEDITSEAPHDLAHQTVAANNIIHQELPPHLLHSSSPNQHISDPLSHQSDQEGMDADFENWPNNEAQQADVDFQDWMSDNRKPGDNTGQDRVVLPVSPAADLPVPQGLMMKDGVMVMTEEHADAFHHITYTNITHLVS